MRMNKTWSVWGFCLCGLLLFCPGLRAEPTEIGAVELKKMMGATEVLVIFPLSPIEFDNLQIPGSVNIPLEEVSAGLPADKNRPLVFYCLGRT